MLLKALRPALRLPQDLLCTLVFSLSSLESRRLAQCPQTHRVKDWDFSTGSGLGGARQVSWVFEAQPKPLLPSQQLMPFSQESSLQKAGLEQDTEFGMWEQKAPTHPQPSSTFTYP